MMANSMDGEATAEPSDTSTKAVTEFNAGADALRAEVRIIALAAIARNRAVADLEVRLGSTLLCPTHIAEIGIYGVDQHLGKQLREAVTAAIVRHGWQVVPHDDYPLWCWQLVLVKRATVSAHELATATRRVKR